jgi:hypothetical protein
MRRKEEAKREKRFGGDDGMKGREAERQKQMMGRVRGERNGSDGSREKIR